MVNLNCTGFGTGFGRPLTYLLLMSSFICSAISKSAAGFLGEGATAGCDLDIDFRIASDLALDGDKFAFMFEGERGMSGDTAFEEGAILVDSVRNGILPGVVESAAVLLLCPPGPFAVGLNGSRPKWTSSRHICRGVDESRRDTILELFIQQLYHCFP